MISEHVPRLVAEQLAVRPNYRTCYYCDVALALGVDDYCVTPWGEILVRPGTERPTTDHRLPTSRGGTDAIENLVLACVGCNSSKCDKTDEEFDEWRISTGWYERHGYYSTVVAA